MLAACNSEPQATSEADSVTAGASPEQSAQISVGFEMTPGLYSISNAGKVYAKTRLNSDLSYTDLSPDNTEVGGGIWEVDGATFCLNPHGNDGELRDKRCWVNSPSDETGSFTATLEDGSESYLLTPISD
ncbi:MAG: hypothetical protein ABJP48_01570 [Erythrobacter sp.]